MLIHFILFIVILNAALKLKLANKAKPVNPAASEGLVYKISDITVYQSNAIIHPYNDIKTENGDDFKI